MNPTAKEVLETYRGCLYDEERSRATMKKYLGGARKFAACLEKYGDGDGREVVNKDKVRGYKQYLKENYRIASANSMLAAINSFFTYIEYEERKVQLFKIQRAAYCQPETETTRQDYRGLIQAAREAGDTWMSVPLQTVGSTDTRINELKYISVKSLETGHAEIYNKGKSRVVLFPGRLVDVLRKYCRKKRIQSGSIFITGNGNLMNRSDVSKRVKRLAVEVGANTAKVSQHDLRHLFARIFYSTKKDVMRLMDLLGHSNISTTRIYTTGTEEEPRYQLGQMNLILGQVPTIQKSKNTS